MPRVERSSDVVEVFAEKSISFGIMGIVALAFGTVLWIFRGEGMLLGLCFVLIAAGVGCVGWALYNAFKIRKVPDVSIKCVYCDAPVHLVAKPDDDVTCPECHRKIPIEDGKVLEVAEVRCGFCNTLNYYSKKTQFLICESCDREIPIALDEGAAAKHAPRGFVREDDAATYELSLIAFDHASEELISCLQHMLALNRNQVKQMLENLPATLLTGIPRKKAEMLAAQITANGGVANFRAL